MRCCERQLYCGPDCCPDICWLLQCEGNRGVCVVGNPADSLTKEMRRDGTRERSRCHAGWWKWWAASITDLANVRWAAPPEWRARAQFARAITLRPSRVWPARPHPQRATDDAAHPSRERAGTAAIGVT